jgi:23S rRNA pseudouridine1911/1915/1917 synthase
MDISLPEHLAHERPHALLTGMPSSFVRRLIHARGIEKKGSLLRCKLFAHEQATEQQQFHPFQVLYEDDFLLIINKPVGLDVHPNTKEQTDTLANAVAAYYAYAHQHCRVRHMHRLDKYTTGVIVYAKNEWAHVVLDEAMRNRHIRRSYVCITEGIPERPSGTIDAPIGSDRHHPTRRRVSNTGERAVTRYAIAETYVRHALVRVSLETGRTHQIRVHMAHIGHPIAGDGMYGGHRDVVPEQALHAERVELLHPWTRAKLVVTAPLPDAFAIARAQLRRQSH